MRTQQVGIHQACRQFRGDVLRRPLDAQPRVVDDHVEPAGALNHLRDGRVDGIVARDIHGDQGESTMPLAELGLATGAEDSVSGLG